MDDERPIDGTPHFDGPEYQPERDHERLTGQMLRVWQFICDHRWHTLHEIAAATGAPEASVSAQLRHFRKRRFGSHVIERQHIERGLFQYRLVS